MASPIGASTLESMAPRAARWPSLRHATRAPSRSAFCSGSRLRPSDASFRPMLRNTPMARSCGAFGLMRRSTNSCTACVTACRTLAR